MAQGEGLTSSQRSLLSRATSATSEPTPGYVYKDITDMVAKSVVILPAVEDYLLQKLSRLEPYIKFKCLKLLKNLCARLPSEFNRSKVCQSYAVMECRNYKAPYSEYNGDYLCQMVRNEVEDLLKVVYENKGPVNPAGSHAQGAQGYMMGFGNPGSGYGGYGNQGKIGNVVSGGAGSHQTGFGATPTGFGNSVPFQPSGIGNVGGYGRRNEYANAAGFSKMEGFGNYVPPSSGSSKSTGSQAIKFITDVATKYLPTSLFGKIERVGSAITTSAMDQIERHFSSNPDSRPQGPPMGGSTSFSHVGSNISISSSQYDRQKVPTDTRLLPSLIEDTNQAPGAVDSSGELEAKLVKDILSFSGIKVTPSQQILDEFMSRLKDVNMRYVVEELVRNLNNRSNKWQLQLRIMCVLEALIVRGKVADGLKDDLKRDLEPMLIKCCDESQLRVKAERLMRLLGNTGLSSSNSEPLLTMSSANSYELGSSQQGPKTLDLFSEMEFSTKSRGSVNVPSDFNNPAFDLMDSFTPVSSVSSPKRKEGSPTEEEKHEDDIFDFDKLTSGTVKPKPSSSEKDLFDVLDHISFQPKPRKDDELL